MKTKILISSFLLLFAVLYTTSIALIVQYEAKASQRPVETALTQG